MHAYARRFAPAAFLWKARTRLHWAARALDTWLGARAKSREDALALELMSDRELRDIGLDPGRINNARWERDWRV
jgi:uncharacterized protein YjiS (DUF1127 family)